MKDVYEIKSGIFITKSGEAIEVKDGYFVARGSEKCPIDTECEFGCDYGPFDLKDIQYGLKVICEENDQNSEC